ncbi:MAG: nucleoside triphosphate pyrophosphohydrolase [Verrucomicrobia bacterium]|nr:MAG: nucleoside triphosphate pyrophosphohydrolase [Verrucomicrobiota bacterium]
MTDAAMMDAPDPATQLARLRAIMHRLRAPGGCPWDAEQSHASLIPNLIEEAYETVDTIQRGDFNHLREELGDLLLQVVFHSELAEEAGHFNFDDVAREICDKMIRRHPHVFAQSAADTPEAVLIQWDEIKREEKGSAGQPYLYGIGHGLPALLRAAKLQKKAAKVGFDWPDETGVLAKIHEELTELHHAIAAADPQAIAEETGDLLFSIVNLTRFHQLDPELVMAAANRKFEQRFATMQQRLLAANLSLEVATLDQMEAAWQQVKTLE